jgi:hypothetical protein
MTEKEAADLHNKFIDEVGFGNQATFLFAQAIRAAALEEAAQAVDAIQWGYDGDCGAAAKIRALATDGSSDSGEPKCK